LVPLPEDPIGGLMGLGEQLPAIEEIEAETDTE
jgi:hypothetical protein